jgi:hypothetical protein
MRRQSQQTQGHFLGAGVCLGILISLISGCKNSTTPDDKPRIIVRNNCGIAVDIYLDGAYQFFLEFKEYYYIENISLKTYKLEAKRKATQTLLKTVSIEITQNRDYTWTISSTASLAITNNYGETLSIYGDGTYQTDIENGRSNSIQNIVYGRHLLEAKRPNTSTVVASTTIEVLEDKGYTWTITK